METHPMISDEQIQKALDFLVSSAPEIAQARADMIRCDHMRRVTKSLVMKQQSDMPVSAQEREAYASKEYLKCIDDLWEATRKFEGMKAAREGQIALIDAWRSMSANRRGADRIG